MFTIFFQRALTVILFGLALVTFPFLSYASHSWDGYHWARTANPFTLKLGNNLSTLEWQNMLAQTTQDWNSPQIFATTSPLVTVSRNGAVPISDTPANYQSFPQIVMDPVGNAAAVWYAYDGPGNSIWANNYSANSGWGTATRLENNTGEALGPHIAMDANGNSIAVWYQHEGTLAKIWASRYTAGQGWGTATPISTDITGRAYNPQIVMDIHGNAIAVWYQYDDTLHTNVWSNRYTVGQGWGSATLLENNTSYVNYPHIAMDAEGNAIAVWQEYVGSQTSIWGNRYTAGSGWGTATPIGTNDAKYPQLVMSDNGNAIVMWEYQDGIWVNHYTVDQGWGSSTLLPDVGPSRHLAMDADGNAIAVWSEYDGTLPYNIWASHYLADQGWGTATLVEAGDDGEAKYLQIAMDAEGNAVLVWQQDYYLSNYHNLRSNVWASRYTAGSGWGTAMPIEAESILSSSNPHVAMNDHGQAMAVWFTDIYKIWAINLATLLPASTGCAMVAGTTQVCNGHYGRNGWLALTTLDIADGNHITQASTRLNDSYFDTAFYNNPNEKLHLMCQGVAHTFGLDHQSTDGSSLNSCMDLFSNTGANATSMQSTKPNLHDFEQLNSIYSHLDSTNTPLATQTTLAAEPDDDDPEEGWGRLKNQSGNGLSSTYERYNPDGSKTITHVYWTIEAAANCPRCDHRRDN